MRPIFLVALAIGLAACASQVPMTAYSIQRNTVVNYDPYNKYQSVKAPMIGGVLETNYRLSHGTLRGDSADSIILSYAAKDWAFLSSAHDVDGVALTVSGSTRDVNHDASISEIVSISLPAGYLQKHAATGLNIRVDGDHGFTVITMPAVYVQGFLAAVAQTPPPPI